MNFESWCSTFVNGVAPPATPAPAEQCLEALGHTRAELIGQLANAMTLEQNALVRQYISEAKRRLRAIA